jgi:hypothetical protein
MVYTFARVAMNVEDYYAKGKRMWLRLYEMPAHHTLEAYLDEYLKATGIADDAAAPLFRTAPRTRPARAPPSSMIASATR